MRFSESVYRLQASLFWTKTGQLYTSRQLTYCFNWCPLRESNPCLHLERPSTSSLFQGRFQQIEPKLPPATRRLP